MTRPFALLAGFLLAIIFSVVHTSAQTETGSIRLAQAQKAEEPPKIELKKIVPSEDEARKLRLQVQEKDAKKRKKKAKELSEKRKLQLKKRKAQAKAEAEKRKAEEEKRKAEVKKRKDQANKRRQRVQLVKPDAGNAAATAAARAILQDKRPARALSDGALGRRIKGLRAGLKSRDLPGGLSSQLRRRLAQDSSALRDRSARNAPSDAKRRERNRDRANRERDRDRARRNRDRNRDQDRAARNRDRGRTDDAKIAAARALLRESTSVQGMSDDSLGRRVKALRNALKTPGLPAGLSAQLRRRLARYSSALRARRAPPAASRERDRDRVDRNRDRDRAERNRDRDRGRPGDDQIAAARALLRDRRPAQGLSDGALGRRVKALRDVLSTRGLPRTLSRRLRSKLAQDRRVLRDRVAARNAPPDGDARRDRDRARDRAERRRDRDRADRNRDRAPRLADLLGDRRPSKQLDRRALALRIRAARDVLARRNLRPRDRVFVSRLLRRDRAEFRNRLRARRARRQRELARDRARLRRRFDRPPPVRFEHRPDIAAAEADGDSIERQLLAPPIRRLRRRYSMAEIRRRPDLRLAMPALEIDTVRFGFDSARVAPEEVAKLERVGAILERILIGKPGEVYLIEGHTDAPGSFGYNLELSQRRAEAVRAALLEFFVIPPEALEVAGFGEDFLRIQTQEAEPENRRVTVRRMTPMLSRAGGGG